MRILPRSVPRSTLVPTLSSSSIRLDGMPQSSSRVPGNITLLFLPPKSPELNPVENVWQYLRDNWLSNRVFHSYDDIVALSCQAWNNLIDQPWKIMSIGLRDWAHRY